MEISELLDQLAEFQSEADYLELKKRELLDAVKIPAEVLAAQDEANKRRQAIDAAYWRDQKEIQDMQQTMLAEIVDPPMPPEFVAALAAANAKREEIRQRAAAGMERKRAEAAAAKAKIDAELQAAVADVYKQVETRKVEISAEFDVKAEAVKENMETLTARIKDEVKAAGKTVKAKYYQAIYVRGRVTWNTDMLDGLCVAFPALEKARKVGEPSVTIRRA